MSPPPVIRFADVGQVFGKDDGSAVAALDRLSFEIGRHEFVAVLGPSGCGKSTLLRLTAGLLAPTSGHVEIYGTPVIEPRDEIGIVFQRPVLLPWFDVLGNVVFPLRHKYGRVTDTDRQEARELLRLVELGDFIANKIDTLSGGMQQRVAIARALLLDPEILLSDRIIVMTPRPGSVREILEVALPRPRSLDTLSDPSFHALANHIRGRLFTRRPA